LQTSGVKLPLNPQYLLAFPDLVARHDYNCWRVIHTFAFRWQPGVTEDQKLKVLTEIRALQGQIPGLLETLVGTNISPRSQGYELGGVMRFSDQLALESYSTHPVHLKLLSWLMPLIDPLEVDFEV
jgi:Stress responsive A/B Barrel Domain